MAESTSRPRRRPRQQRARDTVDAIVAAAAERFEADGYEATTDQIAARAGVSIGSLYQYFPNKAALLVAVAEQRMAEDRAWREEWVAWLAAEDPPLEVGLRRLVDGLVASHASRPRLTELLFERPPVPIPRPSGRACLGVGAGLERWLADRVPRPRLAAEVLARVLPPLVHDLVVHPRHDVPLDVVVEEAMALARGYVRRA